MFDEQKLINLYLEKNIDYNTAKNEIKFALDYLFDINIHDFLIKDILFDEQKLEKAIKNRLKNNIPIQYAVGGAFFCGEKFIVNSDVLIPRPETELIIQELLKIKDKNDKFSCLDIGTGSGCLAIICAELFKNAKISASDISEKALATAKLNAKSHNVNINFIRSDIYENTMGKYDVIISNPPYISFNDVDEVDDIVLKNEPNNALFAEDNGLYFYKKIINKDKLNKGGIILCEIGYKQADKIKDILCQQKIDRYSIIKDISGLDRVVVIYM